VERNGKINVEFVVSVPQELQARNWQLVVDPTSTGVMKSSVPSCLR